MIGLGIALVLIGLFLTFSNVFGFTLGVPLMWLGVVLIIAGVVLGIWHFVGGRTTRGRMTGRGPIV